jgi:O-antigen/teichoic acid export membrane protein
MSQIQNKATEHRIPINTFSNLSALLCQLAVSFFMAPFLVHRLGDSAYGVWAVVMSVFGYMGLLDLGMGASLVRYIAQYDDETKRKAMGVLLSSALLFYTVTGLLGTLLGVIIGIFGMHIFNLPESLMGEARLVMVIMGVSLIIRFPGSVFQNVLAGMRLYHRRNVVEITALLVRIAAIVLAIRAGGGLAWLGIITVCGSSLMYLAIFLVAKRRLQGVKIRICNATREFLRELISYGSKVFTTTMLGTASSGSDPLIIGIILSSRWVTFFSIPFMLVNYLKSMLMSLTMALMPVFSNLQARNLKADICFRVLRYSRYVAAIGLFAGAGLLVFGVPFVRLWMGAGYASQGAVALYFLCLSFMFYCLVPCAGRLFMGTGKQHVLLTAAAVHAPVRITLTVALIYYYGISGVALADLICNAGLQLYLLVRSSRYIGVGAGGYVRRALFRPGIAAGIAGLSMWAARTLVYPRTYLQLMIEIALGCAVYVPLAFLVVLTRSERESVLHFIKRAFPWRRAGQQVEVPETRPAPLDTNPGT